MSSIQAPHALAPVEDRRQRAVRLFVWATWLLMTGAVLWFVHRFASRAPTGDDWTILIPPLTGMYELTPRMLWAQANEHRLPLIKVILVPLGRLTHGAFVVENYINALVLSGLAATLIATARRLRGAYRVTDLFFPLALLHFGHYEVLLGRMNLNHVLSGGLAGLVLVVLASQHGPLTPRQAWLPGGVMLALPLCGANGLPVVVAGVAWLAYAAWDARRDGPAGGIARPLALLAPALTATALVGFYFVDYKRVVGHPTPPSLGAVLHTSAQALSSSFTVWVPRLWPWLGLVVPALAALTGALLVHRWWADRTERVRAAGLLLYLGAGLGAALGVGWGRAGLSPLAGTAPRYAVLTLPVLFAVYLAWLVYAPRRTRGLMEAGLLGLICLTLPLLVARGYHHAGWIRRESDVFVQTVHDGAPGTFLAARFSGILYSHGLAPRIPEWINWARRAHLRPFAGAPPNGSWLEEALPANIVLTHQLTWNGTVGRGEGPDPHFVLAVPAPRHVAAVRVRFVLTGPIPSAGWLEVYWRRSDTTAFDGTRSHRFMLYPSEQERTLVVWVNDTIDQLRIDPDSRPCTFELRELTMLTPAARG